MSQVSTRFIPWSPPDMTSSDKEAAIRVIESGWWTQRKETEALEREVCAVVGSKYAAAVSNGTSALICALLAHGIGRDDEVLVPTFTFIATVNAVLAVGAKPVLVDCDPETFNATPEILKKKLTPKTKAILPVDVYGMPVDIRAMEDFAGEHGLVFIEDAAEAIGASYRNRPVGSFAHTAVLSFHMAKLVPMTEGGCLLTQDEEIWHRFTQIRNHGMLGKHECTTFGLNMRTTDIVAAIGRSQLKRLPRALELRGKLVKIYEEGLRGLVDFQRVPDYVTAHPYMIFGFMVKDARQRDGLNQFMNNNGVDTRICWPPVHKQGYHSKLFPGESHPVSEEIAARIINPPLGNGLAEDDVRHVVEVIRKGLGR